MSALVGLFCCPVFFQKPESSSLPCRAMYVEAQQRADLCPRIPASQRLFPPHPLFQHTQGFLLASFSHRESESGSPDSSSTRMPPEVDCTLDSPQPRSRSCVPAPAARDPQLEHSRGLFCRKFHPTAEAGPSEGPEPEGQLVPPTSTSSHLSFPIQQAGRLFQPPKSW